MRLQEIKVTPRTKQDLTREIAENLARRHSTAVVLFHHTIAERLGLGPTDHKCLDLLRERGAMSGSELVAITGLTSGAITGVAARLEKVGYLRREDDPDDRRKQVLHATLEKHSEIHEVIEPLRKEVAELLERFDTRQLTAILNFLAGTTDLIYRHMALLRGEALFARKQRRSTGQEPTPKSPLGNNERRVSPVAKRRQK